MLSPIFNLKQTDHLLIVQIHAPMARLSDMEVCVEENIFYFTAPPYYLKFEIPGDVLTDEDEINVKLKGSEIFINLRKTEAISFPDLDMISKLLCPCLKAQSTKPIIKELNSLEQNDDAGRSHSLEWYQSNDCSFTNEDDQISSEIVVEMPRYGFAGSKCGLFKSESDLSFAIDLPHPDNVSEKRRGHLRMLEENHKFSPFHYLADYFQKDDWLNFSRVHLPWQQPSAHEWPELTSENRHRLIVLTERQLPLISEDSLVAIYLGLGDLLLAYTYDYRVREGEEMTESGWNLVKLASTLSWFQIFDSLPDLLVTFYRRTLTYPLVRSWRFSRLVQLDVAKLLQTPDVKASCLKCLLDIRRLLIAYPGYHVFADLFLDDYIVWIQRKARVSELTELGLHLEKYKVKRADVHLNLQAIEQVGLACAEGENLAVAVQHLSLDSSTTENST